MIIGVLVALLWWDDHLQQAGFPIVGLPAGVVVLVLVVVGQLEAVRLFRDAGLPALAGPAVALSAGLATMPVWAQWLPRELAGDPWLFLMALAAALAGLFLAQMATHRVQAAMGRLGGSTLGLAYLGVLGAGILALRVGFGVPGLVLVLAATKGTDIGAYFVGTLAGRHKIIPWLSPGKSWEGLAGGLAGAAIAAIVTAAAFDAAGRPIIDWWQAGLLGLGLALVGQFGDLCESLIKRDAGRKDSGNLIPEFGGVLDLLDSMFLAAPMAYVVLRLLA